MKNNVLYLIMMALLTLTACKGNKDLSDAYGTFEATEVTISAEVPGKVLRFDLEEGQELKTGTPIGWIDTLDLVLKKQALQAQLKAVQSKKEGVEAQVAVVRQQKDNLMIEKTRLEKLLHDKAATPKQMDDVNGNLNLADRQMAATLVQQKGISHEMEALQRQIDQVEESLRKCHLISPGNGTVLSKYVETNELVAPGKPLYKMADLTEMILRVFISGDQLPKIRIGQEMEVLVDQDQKSNRKLTGVVSWIASSAEFTPKIIQTKEERVNLVYAVKIRVKNDGSLKIAMPGEANFH